MEIEEKIFRLEEMIRWQDQKINGIQVDLDSRSRIVVGLLDLVLEHEKSIGILSNQKLYGSVFALIRPLFESYIRAVWIRYCATDTDVERFIKGELDKKFGTLIDEIENVEGYDVKALSDIKSKNWKMMNDFTHGGISQAWARSKLNEITPSYPKEDQNSAVDFSVIVGLLATMEVANIINDENFAREIVEKMEGL